MFKGEFRSLRTPLIESQGVLGDFQVVEGRHRGYLVSSSRFTRELRVISNGLREGGYSKNIQKAFGRELDDFKRVQFGFRVVYGALKVCLRGFFCDLFRGIIEGFRNSSTDCMGAFRKVLW